MKKLLTLLFMTPFIAFAHGEDKEGPHGGHIRMPGAFHTELMLDEKHEAHIFLLDMEFKNPTVQNSKIEVYALNGKTKVNFQCSIMGKNHFHCVPEKKYPLKGELRVKAVRDNLPGNEVSYKLPLPKFAEEKTPSGHDHH
ncbi:MAG: hypothetical protein OM95_02565 [Bdellovibrio sp. ArHS]|uniref:hypothetical protein n=1 Tax=Bdellovibrio sp. ArHS TaxID=1569284 RepID=UPI00058388A5|nr:hypothetical protein [Bdellovibrio sp. ArHS]KHD89626.1 MAG: hypothetical protein OM95_02565 [Bdellovibrio sp. ArHS]